VVRVGYGSGDELVAGRWTAAFVFPQADRRRRRRELIEPQQELARIIGGRRPWHASEDLALRARLDLDQGRVSQAALQLESALSALSGELEGEEANEAARALIERREELHGIATEAIKQAPDGADRETLAELMRELERVLRRRRHGESNQ
jgi:hypothetical protein